MADKKAEVAKARSESLWHVAEAGVPTTALFIHAHNMKKAIEAYIAESGSTASSFQVIPVRPGYTKDELPKTVNVKTETQVKVTIEVE